MQAYCRYSLSVYAPVTQSDYSELTDYQTDTDYEDSLPLAIGNWYTFVLEYRPSKNYTRVHVLRGKPSNTGETLPRFACTAPSVYTRLVEGAVLDTAVDVGFGADATPAWSTDPSRVWTQFADLYIDYPAAELVWYVGRMVFEGLLPGGRVRDKCHRRRIDAPHASRWPIISPERYTRMHARTRACMR